MTSRRAFLKSSGVALFSLGFTAIPEFVAKAALATYNQTTRKKVLVCVFQRGAMDGLMAVSPFTDSNFTNARNRLRMSVGGENGLIDLDGRFAFHPAFKPFKPLYDNKQLAIVHGIGSPDTTRSHFDAQDFMENGTPGKKSDTGWLNRATSKLKGTASPFQSVAFTSALPLSMVGPATTLAVDDLRNFNVKVPGATSLMQSSTAESFESLYEQTSQELLRNNGKESFEAVRMLQSLNAQNYRPAVQYPQSPLANHLKQVAFLIKYSVGLEIAFVESTGWDTHVQQGTVNGQFSRVAADLSQSIAAFWNDIEQHHDDVAVLTMTEFGRTVKENGSGGTDHGRGSCMFVLGNAVAGGKVYGNVPQLAPENLADGRDLPVTTDFRALFTDVATNHLHINNAASLFPAWSGSPTNVFK